MFHLCFSLNLCGQIFFWLFLKKLTFFFARFFVVFCHFLYKTARFFIFFYSFRVLFSHFKLKSPSPATIWLFPFLVYNISDLRQVTEIISRQQPTNSSIDQPEAEDGFAILSAKRYTLYARMIAIQDSEVSQEFFEIWIRFSLRLCVPARVW